ncbi:copper resistance D family protein [Massilia sp. TWR1-2-2]|uniref:copper resistance D family protein n=1 Tax=Massilia sp. TWR1-2-2 TaxID=2804584 RepID=UPI003CEB860D
MVLEIPSAQLAATVALNLSVAVVTGSSMSTAWLRAGQSTWSARCLVRLRALAQAAVVAAILSYGMVLWLEAAAMAEVPVTAAGPAVSSVLTATHYGLGWTIGMSALALVAMVTAVPWRPDHARAANLVRLLALGVFLYSRSIVSHAGAGGDASWAVAADWIHLVLISLWLGEVVVAGLVTLREAAGSAQDERQERARYIAALSRSATIALVGIFVTGLVGAWRGLGSVENTIGNPYATTLLIKLTLVATATMLGGANRFFVMPALLVQLRDSADRTLDTGRRFTLVLQIEAIVLFAALILAAVLSSTSPPAAG